MNFMNTVKYKLLLVATDPVTERHIRSSGKSWDISWCGDSFQALGNIKKHRYGGIVVNATVTPLGINQFLEYLAMELKVDIPVLVTGNDLANSQKRERSNILWSGIEPSVGKIDCFYEMILDARCTNDPLEKTYGLGYMRELFDNDQELISESIHLFRKTVTEKIGAMGEALEKGYFDEVRDLAHFIKPSFQMIENEKSRKISDQICHAAEDHEIEALYRILREEFERILAVLKPQCVKSNLT